MWVSTKGTVEHCAIVLQHLQQVCFVMEIEMCKIVHDIADVCLFIFCVKNLGGIAAQPIFTKDFILCLDEEHVFHGIKVHRGQAIRPSGGQSGVEQLNHSIFPTEY